MRVLMVSANALSASKGCPSRGRNRGKYVRHSSSGVEELPMEREAEKISREKARVEGRRHCKHRRAHSKRRVEGKAEVEENEEEEDADHRQ